MNSYHNSQTEELRKRTEEFPKLLQEINPGIVELAEYFNVSYSGNALEQLEAVLMELDSLLESIDFTQLDAANRIWLHTRLMYLIGETLILRYGGYWFLQADPESDLFLKYVIGGFEKGIDQTIIIDPAAVVYHFLAKPVSRSLLEEIAKLGLGSHI